MDFISKHVVNVLAEDHIHVKKPGDYLYLSTLDKDCCQAKFEKFYSEHLSTCSRICGLTFKFGGAGEKTVPFQVHNRETLGEAWSQCVPDVDSVSRLCWILFHSHEVGYVPSLFSDLQTHAERQIMHEMSVEYKRKPGCMKRTCTQRYFTRLIAAYRYRVLKKSLSTHGTRIGTTNPANKQDKDYKHVVNDGCRVPKRTGKVKKEIEKMWYYVGRKKAGEESTIEWEAVSRTGMASVSFCDVLYLANLRIHED